MRECMRLAIALVTLAACVDLAEPQQPPVQTSGPVGAETIIDGSGLFGCLVGDVQTPPVCAVTDTLARGTPNETETLIPACSSGVVWPCWYGAPDATCAPSGYAIVVVRAMPPPDGVVVDANCALTDRTAGT